MALLSCFLRHVLRATTWCALSTSQLSKVVRVCGVFTMPSHLEKCPHPLFQRLTCPKCSEHEVLWACWPENVLRTTAACNFWSLIRPDSSAHTALANLLFDPPEPQDIRRNSISRLFYLFASHLDLLSTDSFSSLTAPSTVAASAHKKLPSIMAMENAHCSSMIRLSKLILSIA